MIKITKVASDVVERIQRNTGVSVEFASTFSTALVNGEVYQSKSYKRITKRNSYTVCYTQGGEERYGLIEYFVSIREQTLAVITPLLQQTATCYPDVLTILNTRIIPVKMGRTLDVILVTSLLSKTVLVSFNSSKMYICRFPNKFHGD